MKWTQEKIEWFVSYVPGHTYHEIKQEYKKVFNAEITDNQIKNACPRFKVHTGTRGGLFEKGIIPHNKHKTWDQLGYSKDTQERMRKTCFKAGNVPHNAKPIGYERVDKDGYTYIKTEKGFMLKSKYVYEKHYGGLPHGHNVMFVDRDKTNFDPDNLIAVPRKIMPKLVKYDYHDRESMKAAILSAEIEYAVNMAIDEN